MTPPARMPRIAAVPVRLVVLAVLAVGYLPVPIVHSHAASASGESARLGRHVALFHGATSADPPRLHVHVVPPMFFVGGGLGDVTGDDVPDPERHEAPFPPVAQVDIPPVAPMASAVLGASASVAATMGRPTHFLETFSEARGLDALWGVCRC